MKSRVRVVIPARRYSATTRELFLKNGGQRAVSDRNSALGHYTFYTKLLNLVLGLRLKYYNGLQIHRTEWLRNVSITSKGFGCQAELLVRALRAGRTHLQVPTYHQERPGGGSTKVFRWRNILSTLRTIRLLGTIR